MTDRARYLLEARGPDGSVVWRVFGADELDQARYHYFRLMALKSRGRFVSVTLAEIQPTVLEEAC